MCASSNVSVGFNSPQGWTFLQATEEQVILQLDKNIPKKLELRAEMSSTVPCEEKNTSI